MIRFNLNKWMKIPQFVVFVCPLSKTHEHTHTQMYRFKYRILQNVYLYSSARIDILMNLLSLRHRITLTFSWTACSTFSAFSRTLNNYRAFAQIDLIFLLKWCSPERRVREREWYIEKEWRSERACKLHAFLMVVQTTMNGPMNIGTHSPQTYAPRLQHCI